MVTVAADLVDEDRDGVYLIMMIEIEISEGDRIDWALKQFRRKMLRSGLFRDMKKKRFYEKPSEARKRKEAEARRRTLRARRRE